MSTICIGQKIPLFRSGIAQRRALLLDYDGTIAPFVINREQAYPYAPIPELLDEIASKCETHVGIVTGRSAEDIPFLLKTKHRLEVWGCHGLERVRRDGTYWRATLNQTTEQLLNSTVDHFYSCGLAGLVETKPGCVAVHWRGLTSRYREEVKTTAYNCFSPLAGVEGLHILEFDQGVELRIGACNKGNVIETILTELGQEAAVAYLGDDATDEDAFRALHGRGMTILVRQSYRATAAQFWLRPPDDLLWFLRNWIQACTEEEQ